MVISVRRTETGRVVVLLPVRHGSKGAGRHAIALRFSSCAFNFLALAAWMGVRNRRTNCAGPSDCGDGADQLSDWVHTVFALRPTDISVHVCLDKSSRTMVSSRCRTGTILFAGGKVH